MLCVDASVLRLQDMATPKELVDERLSVLEMSPTELGLKLGYKNGYQGYHDLFVSGRIKLTEEKLNQIADLLELPRSHFVAPDQTLARDRYVREKFAAFLKTEIGRSIDADTKRTIESMKFLGKWLPTVQLYQAVALAIEGRYSVAQLAEALELEESDRESHVTGTVTSPSRKRPGRPAK